MATLSDMASRPQRRRSLRDLPKAHLHAHLDGSYPEGAVRELALRRDRGFQLHHDFPTVTAFFEAYGSVPALVDEHDDLAELCRALVWQEAAEG